MARSAEDIRLAYLGSSNHSWPKTVESRARTRNNLELTAAARHIVRLVRRRIAEEAAHEGTSAYAAVHEDELLQLVRQIEVEEGEFLSDTERTSAVAVLAASLEHYGILSTLIENPDINDVIVASFNDISVQSSRKNLQTDLQFPDRETYLSFVEHLLKRAGKSCTIANPVVDASIDPDIRVCVTHESFSPPGMGPTLTIRIARHRTLSLEQLVDEGLAPSVVLNYLRKLISEGLCTIVIAGEVGTGKTTLTQALLRSVPDHEAILIIEDTHELMLQRRFVRTLLTREANTEGAGRIPPAVAIRTGMRMAMNRLVLGEIRDGESAEAFIDVCASGHTGLTTIHSRSARDALLRLELFLARIQAAVNVDTVRRQIGNAIGAVVYLGMDKRGLRRVLEVIEVGNFTDGAVQIQPMFLFDHNSEPPSWVRAAGISQHALSSESYMPVGTKFTFSEKAR